MKTRFCVCGFALLKWLFVLLHFPSETSHCRDCSGLAPWLKEMEKNLLPLATASFFGSLCWTSGSHSVFLLLSPSMLHKTDGMPVTSSLKGLWWAALQLLEQVFFIWQFSNTSKIYLMGLVTVPSSSKSREMESSLWKGFISFPPYSSCQSLL